MRFVIIATLTLPLVLGAGAAVRANDAHHPEKQAKAKATQKKGTPQKPAGKPVRQAPAKKSGPG